MPFRFRWPLSFVLLLGFALPLMAQGGLDWMTSRAWRMQDGLPDQVVQTIAQTPGGYLWLGTKLGLVRFDGHRFVEVGSGDAPALRDFGVDCILVAHDGTLWLGTQGGGVVHLFDNRAKTYGADAGVENDLIRALYEDDAGGIWAGADHGLYRLDTNSPQDTFHRVDDTLRAPNLGVHAIVGDGQGGVWAGGSRLLHFHNPGLSGGPSWQEIELPRQPASMRIWALALASDRSLRVGTLGGLFGVTPEGKVEKESRIPGGAVSLHIDSSQRLWVGTLGDGLFLIDRNGSISHALRPGQFASNAILSITEDSSNDLWIGTQSGLERFSATGMHITRIPGAIDTEFGSVFVDHDRSLWICARQLVHMRDGKAESVALPALRGAVIRSVMRERSGAWWAGTSGRGAYRIDPRGHVDHYTSAIGTNYIRGFLETPEDGVWIASDGGVANWHNGRIRSYQETPGSPGAQALAMSAGEPGELWVGTYHGLSLLRQGHFVFSSAAMALGSHVVWALHRSQDGALWIGTENGLFRWSNGQLHRLPIESGMGGKSIFSILEDDRGRIWLGGSNTVLRVDRAALEDLAEGRTPSKLFAPEIFAVSRETGTELTGGTTSTAQLDGFGGAWFASHDGPLHIEADSVATQAPAPPIMLDQVLVDGQPISASGEVNLLPSARTLEIEATPIALSARPGLQLRRRLLGFDTRWIPLTSLQTATYTNLPPGKYLYRVEAGWEGSGATSSFELRIVQQAQFYRRPAFLFGGAAFLLLLIWVFHLVHVRQVTTRFRLVAQERNRVAREIHDTVVQSCIGVSSLLEAVAIRRSDDAAAAENDLLNTAREQIALTIVEARDAVWDLRHAKDEGGLAHSLRSMLDRMTAVQNTVVDFQCEGTPEPLARETEHQLLMTTREALHNSITHAAPGRIQLRLRYAPEKVSIELRDNGRGFDTRVSGNEPGMHFGLVGMRERMACIAGSCTITSAPGRGTDVTLELPVQRHGGGILHLR